MSSKENYSTKNLTMHLHWKNLVGIKGLYEGSDSSHYLFKFDGIVWQAIPDNLDGYRSFLDFVVYGDESKLIVIDNLAKVILKRIEETYFEGYVLEDIKSGHEWLRIGTDYQDNYYPCMIFKHNPIVNIWKCVMFFDVIDDLYLFLIKNRKFSFLNIFLLSLKICWNLCFALLLFCLPFIVLSYLISYFY